ncbi:hypothetical protein U1Q18_004407, partial [Sarracenia purpurea var. burkii]
AKSVRAFQLFADKEEIDEGDRRRSHVRRKVVGFSHNMGLKIIWVIIQCGRKEAYSDLGLRREWKARDLRIAEAESAN